MIRVDVTDEGGANVPHLRPHDSPTEAESGRGIRLVEALSDRWGVVRGQYAAGRRRTLVWFEVGTGAHRPGSCDLALTHL
jgi:hypothetical protein